MPWHEREISSWEELARIGNETAGAGRKLGEYIFRGQAVANDLRPGLLRLLPDKITRSKALDIEKSALDTFKEHAPFYLPQSLLPHRVPEAPRWWALMQHHYAPTRLLDWTYSPYVAGYFAVNECWNCDGAVYMIQATRLDQDISGDFMEQCFDEHSPPKLVVWKPWEQTIRSKAQQGVFTVSTDVLADHGAFIDDILSPSFSVSEPTYLKLRVPKKLKPELMHNFGHMNIDAHKLFPGADGLGRSVADVIRIRLSRGAGGGV